MEEVAAKPDVEDRVDELAATNLAHMIGVKGRLPDGLVQTYNDFKRTKDRQQPGRTSAEGFAMVIELWRLKTQIGL